MSKLKFSDVTFPECVNDFYKTNGVKVVAYNDEPSLTRQEYAEECDINVIMRKYEKTGVLPTRGGEPMYVDFTSMPTNLMETMKLMDEAQGAFMLLPAAVRKEFDNDATLFVEYALDPQNEKQMQDWGLAPKPVQEPDLAPAPKEPAAKPPAPEPAKAP